MNIFDLKNIVVKDKCPVCGTKLQFDGLMLNCTKKHFNCYTLSFGIKDSNIEYMYCDLNRQAHKNSRKHYFFVSFQMNFMLFADTKANAAKSDTYLDIPFINLDLSKIPAKTYKDYFKTLVIFS